MHQLANDEPCCMAGHGEMAACRSIGQPRSKRVTIDLVRLGACPRADEKGSGWLERVWDTDLPRFGCAEGAGRGSQKAETGAM